MNVLAVVPDYIPSVTLNIVTPLRSLEKRGEIKLAIRTEYEATPQDVAQCDVMVLCRNAEPRYKPIYQLALDLGIPLIYDLDDNLLAAPKGTDAYHYYSNPSRRELIKWLLRNSSIVRVHSPVLQKAVREYNTNVKLVWAAIDWSLVPDSLPDLTFDPLHIVYAAQEATGRQHFPMMKNDLEIILDRFGDHVRLHFLGYHPLQLANHPSVIRHPYEKNYETFFRKFTRFGYGIGLAPMLDDAFHQSKTNLKFRDYAAAGAAGIYADCALYRDSVVDGETGLLISGEAGTWEKAVQRLIDDPPLIEKIRRNARQYVETRYNQETVDQLWLEDLGSLHARQLLSSETVRMIDGLHWSFTGHRPNVNAIHRKLLRTVWRRIVPFWLKKWIYRMT